MHRSSCPLGRTIRFRGTILFRGALALAFALSGLAAQARAQDAPEGVRGLEKNLEKIAKEATPKTVCVFAHTGQMKPGSEEDEIDGYGSGAVISADGYILTCSHVVEVEIPGVKRHKEKSFEVSFSDGRKLPAKVLGKNHRQDYALLKVEASDLPFYEMGDSSALKVGEWVMALGHPGGPYEDLQPAFAAGRVTNLHRKLFVQFMDRFYDDGIQTDVPIFSGNSGGPLISLDGKLVGLNGAITNLDESAYAVPINEAVADLEKLKKGENVAGKAPTDKDFQDFQKQMDPKLQEKLYGRIFKNLGKGFGKIFGGENGENPLGKLFGGGKDGENPFGKLFGEDGGGDFSKMLKKLFSGEDGEKGEKGEKDDEKDQDEGDMDFARVLKEFQKLFGGGKDGENPFGKMFGGEGGSPDMGKLMDQLRKMFGQGTPDEQGDDDEEGQPGPKKRAPAPAAGVDKGGYLGVRAVIGDRAKGLAGVLVDESLKGSPAEKAGLVKGDVIVAVDSEVTPDLPALQEAIKKHAPGTKVTLSVDRSRMVDETLVRERVEVKLTIGARDGGK